MGSAADEESLQATLHYVDRVLEAGAQQDDWSQEEQETAGLTRSIRVEYSLAAQSFRGIPERVQGLTLSGFLGTANYGALSVDASGSMRKDGYLDASRAPLFWRLEQRALPLEAGWLAQHSAGNIGTPLPALAYGLGRVFIPVNPLTGLSGSWTQGKNLMVNAAVGRGNTFSSGIDAYGFELNRGNIASAGLQWGSSVGADGGARLEAAIQSIRATEVPSSVSTLRTNTAASWGSLAWQGVAPWANEVQGATTSPMHERLGGLRVQGQWLSSRSDGILSQGAWMDAAWRTEWLQNHAGVYRFEPELRWGTFYLPGDLQGAYWRADVLTQRWQVGWLVEADNTLTRLVGADSFWNGYGRYRLNTSTAFGGSVSVRTGMFAGRQVEASWDHQSGFGQSMARARLLSTSRSDFASLAFDHHWPLAAPWVLSTSLIGERQRGLDRSGQRLIWGVLSSYAGSGGQRLDASLRGARGNGAQSLSLNLAAGWQIQREWSLFARAYISRGMEPQLTTLTSALTQATDARWSDKAAIRGVQFVLRYDWGGGNTPAPLGGTSGSGAGALVGSVFLDGNTNGHRDAAEPGIPNVAIVLDGRFAARTDSQGRFEFPAVVAGPHTLQIEPDNVPLPWSPVTRERLNVEVPVRGTATLDFPLQRD